MVNGPSDLNYETLLSEQIVYVMYMYALLSHYQEPSCASQIFQHCFFFFLLFNFLT